MTVGDEQERGVQQANVSRAETPVRRDTGRMTRSAAVSGAPPRRPLSVASIIVGAWVPAAGAVLLVTIIGEGWPAVVRLVVTAAVYAPVAAVLLARRRVDVAVIVGALSVSSGLLALVVSVYLATDRAPVPAAVLGVSAVIARQPEIAALGVLLWLFVTHPLRRWGVIAGLAAIGGDLVIWSMRAAGVALPTAIPLIPLGIALASFLTAGAVLAVRWGRGRAAERETLSWLLAGVVLLAASYLRLVEGMPPLGAALCDAAFVLAQGLLPTAILAAVFTGGDDGAPIDRRLSAGVTWTQSLAVAISFSLAVDGLGTALGMPATVSGAVAAGALAIAFGSMLKVVRQRTARVFFGPGVDVRAVLAGIGARLDDDAGRDALAGMADALRVMWHLSGVTIDPVEGEPAHGGEPGPFVAEHLLTVGGRDVCVVRVSAYDEATVERVAVPMLMQVGPLLALAVQAAVSNDEVSQAQERALEVRREERRMLHRVLHDELAPSLAGISFSVSAARRCVDTDTRGALVLVADARHALAERAETVRQLARSLLPSALDAGDLEGAIASLSPRLGAQTPLRVEAPGTDVLDAELQIALYLITADIVDEIPDARLHVHIAVESERAVLRVVADGGGKALPESAMAVIGRRCADAGAVAARIEEADGSGVEVVMRR